MNEKNKCDNLEPVELRAKYLGYGGERDEYENIDTVVRKDGPNALPFLKKIIENNDEHVNKRCRAMEWLVSLSRYSYVDVKESFEILSKVVFANLDNYQRFPRQDALMALSCLAAWRESGANALDFMVNLAESEKSSKEVRENVLSALANTRSPGAIIPLVRGILETGEHRLVKGVQDIYDMSWQDKARVFVDLLEKNPFRSSQVPAKAIIRALSPSRGEEESPSLYAEIGDYLIAASRNKDERVSGILAKLLIESEGGDQAQAGYRINEYQKDHQVPASELEGLRKAVGGEAALSGVMGVLQRDLKTYFQEPIHELNENTRKSWDKAVSAAHNGLVMRLWMSGTVFVVGIVLLLVSSWRILFGNSTCGFNPVDLIPFVSGLGTMLLIIYSGPLKEIRQAVTDLATASAAFIAYVHRVLETSHTFSFYYLHQNITFEDMKKSSDIIKEAMSNTVDALNREALDSSVETISKTLKMLSKSIPKDDQKPG